MLILNYLPLIVNEINRLGLNSHIALDYNKKYIKFAIGCSNYQIEPDYLLDLLKSMPNGYDVQEVLNSLIYSIEDSNY